jgi:hypothetical protein
MVPLGILSRLDCAIRFETCPPLHPLLIFPLWRDGSLKIRSLFHHFGPLNALQGPGTNVLV